MQELNLWLIRHGESYANKGAWSNTPLTIQLTQTGIEQVKKTAEQVVDQPDLIIVSPAERAIQSALPIRQRWPTSPVETWPIQELVYLSPTRYSTATVADRQIAVQEYWRRADPYFRDGADAELFADFIKRVESFHTQLLNKKGFIIAVGHGQFFKAYQFGLVAGFSISGEWMRKFREIEIARPILNGEIIKISQ